jgi:hypothetical protein
MATSTQNVTNVTSNIGAAQQPYYNMAMQGAAGLLTAPTPRYVSTDPVTGKQTPIGRIANFTDQQKNIQGQIAGMQAPSQFGDASTLATAAGLGSLQAGQYTPGQFNVGALGNLGNVRDATAERVSAQNMQAAQTGYNPNLTTFQMQAPAQFGQQQTEQYMSPYIRNVLDTQKREAIRDARQGQIVQDLGAARQGTYGGSRQLLAGLERERGLGQQLGDIEARGLQSAFENAQAQFERDRGATMTAQQQNLAAQLGVQQLGTDVGLKTALANLDAEQQARVQNMTAENQMRGMNAENALRAALSNQQADLGVRGQNLQGAMQTQQMGLDAQRMAEQSRQFGSQQGLAGLAQANQAGQTLSNIGSAQQQADAQRLGMQQSTAAQEQALNQQKLDLSYSDFQKDADDPYTRLQRYMNLMSGVPNATNTTTTSSAPGPGLAQQLAGAGLGAYSTYKMFSGG